MESESGFSFAIASQPFDLYIGALVCRIRHTLRYAYILCLHFLREVGQHHLHIHFVCFRIPSLLFAPLSQPNESDPV